MKEIQMYNELAEMVMKEKEAGYRLLLCVAMRCMANVIEDELVASDFGKEMDVRSFISDQVAQLDVMLNELKRKTGSFTLPLTEDGEPDWNELMVNNYERLRG